MTDSNERVMHKGGVSFSHIGEAIKVGAQFICLHGVLSNITENITLSGSTENKECLWQALTEQRL